MVNTGSSEEGAGGTEESASTSTVVKSSPIISPVVEAGSEAGPSVGAGAGADGAGSETGGSPGYQKRCFVSVNNS